MSHSLCLPVHPAQVCLECKKVFIFDNWGLRKWDLKKTKQQNFLQMVQISPNMSQRIVNLWAVPL